MRHLLSSSQGAGGKPLDSDLESCADAVSLDVERLDRKVGRAKQVARSYNNRSRESTFSAHRGHEIVNPRLPDDDCAKAVVGGETRPALPGKEEMGHKPAP
jgi:hypothetical protein